MPLYTYECKNCGLRFERRQHIAEDLVRTCPECGGEVHRLIQPVGIIFKGSGFYVTDNRMAGSPTVKRVDSQESAAPKTSGNDTRKEEEENR